MMPQQIIDCIFKASPAEQTEVTVVESHEHLTRFANNSIHQNVSEKNTQVTVRAVVGKRVGIVSSNDLRRDAIERAATTAHALATLQPENPEFKGLPGPAPLSSATVFDEATALCSPAERAARVGIICKKAAAGRSVAAGSMTTSTIAIVVANSLGVHAEHQATLADSSMVITSTNSSGWAQASGWRLDSVNVEQLSDEAMAKVRLGIDPVDPEPGEYTVILDPYATADLLEMLALDGMSALAVQEGRSWMNGRVGTKAIAEIVTIVDDGLDKTGWPIPFDFEGLPKEPVSIVDRGVVGSPVYDSFTAGREDGKRSTGHATPASPSERWGPLPMNLFLKPGGEPLESMIRSTKQGLYITRFWYTRTVHPRDAVVTGMTRDGTFVVRDGEIAHPVKSLRFTQSFVQALRHAEAIGHTPRLLRSAIGAVSAPPVKISQFRFTSATR